MAELFHDAEFWVLVGFLIFFGLVGRTGWRLLKGGLDARTKAVGDQLEEARRLREEAQNLLDGYRAKQEQALKDASEILEAAKEEAELMRREGEEALKRSLAAREAQATDRIAQAEQAAIQSVRTHAVELAVRAATGLMSEAIDKERAGALVDQAIDELPQRVRA